MSTDQYQQLKTILARAIEYEDETDRYAFVERSCGGDTALLDEANALLAEAEKLLRQPNDEFEAAAAVAKAKLRDFTTPREEQRIGAYRVQRELGRGGMGAVYLAERADGEFEKQVAIKVVKRGVDTDEVLRRFKTERGILARLEHPNIARLLDAGTTHDGLPYFVMEYVDGAPVTRYVREARLSIEDRLRLFLKICGAVEAAHKKMVIHRDLKPGNILVTSEGEPKLLDFGIAKMLTPTPEFTATGEQHLTPTCASPEQARGEVLTAASDLYSLGALLFELLAGRRPFRFQSQSPTRDEVARVICEQEPPLPSVAAVDRDASSRLRGDLDAIVLRAMQRDPDRRYPSVAAFADDIRRHLEGKEVRPLPLLNKSSARRRWLWVAGLILLAGILLSPLLRRVEWRAAAPPPAAPAMAEKSIAILPFDNFGDENPAYFADGVQDNMLTDLGKVGDLKVLSRNAVAPYRGKSTNAREIGRELGVASVLVGSVQKSGDRVRINAQLIDTRTDTQIWAQQYDRKIEDIFTLQSELAQTIVKQLKATLSSGERAAISKGPTENLAAYDLYLRARGIYSTVPAPNPQPEWHEVVTLARGAVERDPKFTRAHCLLSEVELLIYRYGDDHTPARLASAREAAEAALRLEPDLEEARLALARYYYHGLRDYQRTEEELAQIPTAGAHSVEFHLLASLVARRRGKWEESIRHGQRAIELDPQNHELAVNLAQTLNGLRRHAEANRVIDAAIGRRRGESVPRLAIARNVAAIGVGDLPAARAALDAFPEWDAMDYEYARTWLCVLERDYARGRRTAENAAGTFTSVPNFWLIRATIARGEGKIEEARRMNEEAKRVAEEMVSRRPEDPEVRGEFAIAAARLGLKEEALASAQRAVAMAPLSRDAIMAPSCLMQMAEVLTLLNDRDGALETLARVRQMPYGGNYGGLKFNPAWDELRDDPRFEQLLEAWRAPL